MDWNQFNQLRELDPTGALEREMLEIFLKDTKEDLQNLGNDPKAYAHRIKGRAAQLGFPQLSTSAHELQQDPQNPELFRALQSLIQEALMHISQQLLR